MASNDIIPDLLAPNLKIVFCGTALGKKSAAAKAYYANPANQFWPVLHRCGFTPHRVDPQDYASVLQYGIGLTDLCKHASGNDDELPPDAFDVEALRRKILRFQPGILAFTSKHGSGQFLGKRTVQYGLQEETIGKTRIYVCCSTSGRARGAWREEVWQELFRLIPQNP